MRSCATRECVLGICPEHMQLGRPGISFQVEMVEALGADVLIHGSAGGKTLVIRAPSNVYAEAGQLVQAGYDASALHWFDSQITRRMES